MELLLNFVWLMLALPAFWIWRRELSCLRGRRKLRGTLALGCLFILLFPVISASDDLHFVRPDMEESSQSKRALRQTADKSSSAMKIAPPSLALTTDFAQIAPAAHIYGLAFVSRSAPLHSSLVHHAAQRGPPGVLSAY